MMRVQSIITVTFLLSSASALSIVAPNCNRRTALINGITAAVGIVALPTIASAAEDNVSLSEDEMAAKVKRKMELLGRGSSGSSGLEAAPVGAMNIRSDVNPEAGANLRSRSSFENAKVAIAKQQELKNRTKAQKRDDLCEMLGRGC
mmetsp:Transcript_48880/g.56367  ORF Transcript_48880/g.56367 Transcript_48880/m.56367 type:complete len:147 (+) Transcript_48880:80-520(+)